MGSPLAAFSRVPWRWYRRLAQAALLLGFLWLFRRTELRADDVPTWVDLAFRLDPLIALAAMIAARAFIAALLLSLVTLALTAVFARAFCGWVCPLGTLLDWLGPATRLFRRRDRPASRRWRPLRYWLLAAILVGAIGGLPLVGYFDPFALLVQGLTFAVDPALKWLADAGFAWLYFHAPESVTGVSEPVYAFLGERLLPFEQAVFAGAGVSAGVLGAILLLERAQRRFWCRNLCPLGALLGLVARGSRFGRKPSGTCRECGQCLEDCRMSAFEPGSRHEPQACVVCMDCVDRCPEEKASFRWRRRRSMAPVDISRRGLIGACAVGAALPAAHAASRAMGIAPRNARLLRPPGAASDDSFLDLCVRCGECMKVCITNGLQPILLEAGPGGLFAPRLVPRTGYCEYGCMLCSRVCPTGAIPLLELEAKQALKMGKAVFDEELCLPFAENEACIVCEEHCPIADKAIKLDEIEVTPPGGETLVVGRPRVDEELCIGCGFCEYVCPIEGPAGIRVQPL